MTSHSWNSCQLHTCPPPSPHPCTPCDTHHGALVSTDVTAHVDASLGIGAGLLHCGDLVDVGAHVGLHVGVDVGADIFHV